MGCADRPDHAVNVFTFNESLVCWQIPFLTPLTVTSGHSAMPRNSEINMDEEKSTNLTTHYEERQMDALTSEYEPPSDYKIHWRTFAAIFALAMGNVCAAMSNTASHIGHVPWSCALESH